MSIRFEDRGVTLRMFKNEQEATSRVDCLAAIEYESGWLIKNHQGRWVDSHGELPVDWQPVVDLVHQSVSA